jgi:Radical SAM superfamily.
VYCKKYKDIIQVSPSESPKILFIEATKMCNLYCSHCFNNSGESIESLKYNDFVRIKKIFLKYQFEKIIISGGEFFLLKEAIDILNIFKGFTLLVLSNGTIINDNHIDTLISNNFNIQITLTGHTKEIDNVIRQTAFEGTINTIEKIVKLGGRNNLKVSYAISKVNCKYIEDFILFCKSKGIKNIQFTFVYFQGRAKSVWNKLRMSNIEKLNTIEELIKLNNKYSNDVDLNFSGLTHYINSLSQENKLTCSEICEEVEIHNDLSTTLCYKLDQYLKCNNVKIDNKNFYRNVDIPYIESDKCNNCRELKECLQSCLV